MRIGNTADSDRQLLGMRLVRLDHLTRLCELGEMQLFGGPTHQSPLRQPALKRLQMPRVEVLKRVLLIILEDAFGL